jgi:hypothetical protein
LDSHHAILIATWMTLLAGAAADAKLLASKTAMGDWTSDAPGVRRKIRVDDLPPPGSNILAINPPRVISRPARAQLQVPSGFKIDMMGSLLFSEDGNGTIRRISYGK